MTISAYIALLIAMISISGLAYYLLHLPTEDDDGEENSDKHTKSP